MATLAELLLEQGRQAAQLRQRQGEIAAQNWANLSGIIGNTTNAIVKEQQEAPIRAQEAKLRDLQTQEAQGTVNAQQRTASDQAALDTAMGSGLDLSHIETALQQTGHAHLIPQVRKSWNDAETAATNLKLAKAKADDAERDYWGALAAGVKPHLGEADGGMGAAQIALQHAAQQVDDNGKPLYPEASQYLQQIQDPQHLASLVDGLIAQSPTYSKQAAEQNKPVTVGPDQSLVQPGSGKVIFQGTPKVPNSQEATFQYQGKVVKGDYIPGANGQPGRYVYNGKDVTGQVTDKPPASVQVLNQMGGSPDQPSPLAKMIADYKVAPPSARSLATPAGAKLMAQVQAINPSFDATQFPARSKMRQAFTSGSQGQTINSLNTAISHIDQFTRVADALGNGNFTPGNAAYQWLKQTFGDSAPTNFNGIRDIMSGELAAAFKKSGATDDEIANVKSSIAAKNSPKQLQDYLQTIALPALGSKVVNFDQQYRQVMGQDDPFKILLPESEAILRKYGIDPTHPQIGGGQPSAPKSSAAPTVGSTVTYQGKSYRVKAITNGQAELEPLP